MSSTCLRALKVRTEYIVEVRYSISGTPTQESTGGWVNRICDLNNFGGGLEVLSAPEEGWHLEFVFRLKKKEILALYTVLIIFSNKLLFFPFFLRDTDIDHMWQRTHCFVRSDIFPGRGKGKYSRNSCLCPCLRCSPTRSHAGATKRLVHSTPLCDTGLPLTCQGQPSTTTNDGRGTHAHQHTHTLFPSPASALRIPRT